MLPDGYLIVREGGAIGPAEKRGQGRRMAQDHRSRSPAQPHQGDRALLPED